MTSKTKINWADFTWNFLLGCERVSDGCDHCYAIPQVHMHAANPKPQVAAANAGLTLVDDNGLDWTGHVRFLPERLRAPLYRQVPTRWFVNSLSDLFHKDVILQVIAAALAVIACCPQHTFLALTKRHSRMRAVLTSPEFYIAYQAAYAKLAAELRAENPARWGSLPKTAPWPVPNLHLGVSAEDQKRWDLRIPALLDCREAAGVLWVSYEPAIGELDASMCDWTPPGREGYPGTFNPLTGEWWPAPELAGGRKDDGRVDGQPRLDWVVAGGENGERECDPGWLLGLRDQCAQAGVPFWMKQTGTVLARRLGLPGKGDDMDLLPPAYRVRQLPGLELAA